MLVIAQRRREAIRWRDCKGEDDGKFLCRDKLGNNSWYLYSCWLVSHSVLVWDHLRGEYGPRRVYTGVVNSSFTPQDWLMNLRVSKATFKYLCEQLRSSVTKSDTIMRKAIPTEKRIGPTLCFLATGANYWTMNHNHYYYSI